MHTSFLIRCRNSIHPLLSCNIIKSVSVLNHLRAATSHTSSRKMSSDLTSGLDETQVKLLGEECLVVDDNDNITGHASKKDCHLWENISKGMLHRAFSVFLFNSEGKLLLQKRADAKITFPGFWANTCCSHPLYVPAEMEDGDAIGVKRAAQRKLKHELGIEPEQVPLDSFHYLSRVHYKAPCEGTQWGEHEIDYILFIQREVDVKPEPNEVQDFRYVDHKELKKLLQDSYKNGVKVSPWFRLIAENCLQRWWQNINCLDKVTDHSIVRFA